MCRGWRGERTLSTGSPAERALSMGSLCWRRMWSDNARCNSSLRLSSDLARARMDIRRVSARFLRRGSSRRTGPTSWSRPIAEHRYNRYRSRDDYRLSANSFQAPSRSKVWISRSARSGPIASDLIDPGAMRHGYGFGIARSIVKKHRPQRA